MSSNRYAVIAMALCFIPAISSASANVILTFDHNPTLDFQDIDQSYGDRVTESPDLLGHAYDITSGSTPNVSVTYGPNQTRIWTTGYGDLENVLFNDLDGDTSLQIELTADAGFEVGLFGFDVASFVAAGLTIEDIQVRDGNGNVLYSAGSTLIPGTGHNDFDFTSGLFAGTLIIDIDLTGLGDNSDDIAIDNVSFSQRVETGGVILTFDHNPTLDFQDIDQSYGDRVTESPDLLGHAYDITSGSTPNVSVTYGPNQTRIWTTGYGDLENVLFNDLDGDTSLQIELTADAGFEVGLFGFDVASFVAAGLTIEDIQVRDGNGNVLYSAGSTLIPGTGHNDFDFTSGLFAGTLIIDIDLTGLGDNSDDIAIDNVSFSQRAVVAFLGDVNLDGVVDFLDIAPFIAVLSSQGFQAEADIDENGVVDFLDIQPFIDLLAGQ